MSTDSSSLSIGRLQQQHWIHAFSETVFERGRVYAKQGLARIVNVTYDGIEACCHGSAERPYRQNLKLTASDDKWQISGRCNCQAVGFCKHMVAVLLVLEQLQAKGDPSGQPTQSASTPEPRLLTDVEPTPVLQLASYARLQYDSRKSRMIEQAQHRAALSFSYAGFRVYGQSSHSLIAANAKREAVRVVRNTEAEQRHRELLHALGLRTPLRRSEALPEQAGDPLQLADEQAWIRFVRFELPKLREAGWTIIIHPGFRYDIEEVQRWSAAVQTQPDGWFDLDLGIEVNGQKVSLLPILLQSIRQTPWLLSPKALAERKDDDVFIATLQGTTTKRIALPYGRLKPVFKTLGELYFADEIEDGKLRLAKADTARLGPWVKESEWQWSGDDGYALAEKLAALSSAVIKAPKGLNATLRPYQLEGLKWMQALREVEMGGILADDMGLGKTLQSLAHLLVEKQAGRLTEPALIVMPTSLIGNWQDEAARFAPSLKILTLQGPKRAAQMKHIAEADVLLTTYALLARDAKHLTPHQFSVVLLDEAQNIKNPRSKAASVAASLNARQRVCLTGTPLENHLGELWALFNFLLPNWLGDEKSFAQTYRVPIEKHGNAERLTHLTGRIRPFILRRTKEQVAKDLPPKTVITQPIELTELQRDRYEALRLSMDQELRTEIAKQGLGSSQLLVIEALLRLRQVCCDMRLLEPDEGYSAQQSGKLTHLMQMLEELFAEGRKVLLFSQFSTMLGLIEHELNKRKIPYALLTGTTRDRAAQVKAFQEGRLPIFLISLKAGGSGLNLTAADTVIHFDPWWNPAAEAQASDRAYRIGQDKPVFVYKLIAKGSVEEKIQALQARKAQLAKSLLDGGSITNTELSESDIHELFAPLT